MPASFNHHTVWASLIAVAAAFPHEENAFWKRDQCADTLTDATNLANALQSHYYDPSTGQWNGGGILWTDANLIEDFGNLMLGASVTTWADVYSTSALGIAGADTGTDWTTYLGGANDDSLWLVLTLWKIADYMNWQGQDASPYIQNAETIYNMIADQWDDTCGGGVWWSTAHTYKNAVTNELFLLTSAQAYTRFGGDQYLTNAQNTWDWLYNSGMRNAQGLWNDGLTQDGTCVNNGQETWIYNQGVIASGLGYLYQATGSNNYTLLEQAQITLDATIEYLTIDNILKESCDSATNATQCDHDQQMFKGLWTKHVQYYLDAINNSTQVTKYSSFLGSQVSAVYHYGTDSSDDCGSVWYAPNQGGSVFTPETSSACLEAYVSGAKYGPCPST